MSRAKPAGSAGPSGPKKFDGPPSMLGRLNQSWLRAMSWAPTKAVEADHGRLQQCSQCGGGDSGTVRRTAAGAAETSNLLCEAKGTDAGAEALV